MSKKEEISNSVNHYDVAKNFFDSAMDEIFLRIKQREVVLYVWLSIIGSLLSFASAKNDNMSSIIFVYIIPIILPIIALGFATRIAQHEKSIAKIILYIKVELSEYFAVDKIKPWVMSDTLNKKEEDITIFVGQRGIFYELLLIIPTLPFLLNPLIKQLKIKKISDYCIDETHIILLLGLMWLCIVYYVLNKARKYRQSVAMRIRKK